jgi:hypothetical protein
LEFGHAEFGEEIGRQPGAGEGDRIDYDTSRQSGGGEGHYTVSWQTGEGEGGHDSRQSGEVEDYTSRQSGEGEGDQGGRQPGKGDRQLGSPGRRRGPVAQARSSRRLEEWRAEQEIAQQRRLGTTPGRGQAAWVPRRLFASEGDYEGEEGKHGRESAVGKGYEFGRESAEWEGGKYGRKSGVCASRTRFDDREGCDGATPGRGPAGEVPRRGHFTEAASSSACAPQFSRAAPTTRPPARGSTVRDSQNFTRRCSQKAGEGEGVYSEAEQWRKKGQVREAGQVFQLLVQLVQRVQLM